MMFQNLVHESFLLLPILGWAILAILVLIAQIFTQRQWVALILSIGGLAGLMVYSIYAFNSDTLFLLNKTIALDPLSQIFNLIGLGIVIAVLLSLIPGLYKQERKFKIYYEQLPEFIVCILFSGFGSAVLASAVDLTSLFLGLEILSIGLYCLCGFYRTEIQSTESAFKYLMIGAFSTVIFLYGIAFIYGATGATQYLTIVHVVEHGASPLLLLGMFFMMAGLAFKLAFVPFHLYTADVYEGAPTPVTGYLATIVKVGALAASLRIFWGILDPLVAYWQPIWIGLCCLSILIGNIVALQQRTIKKLLAFSSISHAGFLGLALLIANPSQNGNLFALLAYLVVYSSMTLGIFALLTYIENRDQPFLVEDLKGFGQKRFGLGLIFSIFILGLAGIPPFAGFMIKFYVFEGLIQQGFGFAAILAVIGSIIGAGYYLKILVYLFMYEPSGEAVKWPHAFDRMLSLRLVIFVGAAITVLGGIRPQIYADWILSTLTIK